MALRHGSQNIDQKHMNKFKGRVFCLIALPLAVGLGATLINDVGNMVKKAPAFDNQFSRYLIDDRSWAYNYNFAPRGNSSAESDIKPSSKGSFVDLSFDPYPDNANGKERIKAINEGSSLAGQNTIFSNTALTIAYGLSQAFSATDYINFQGSEDSLHLLNGSGSTTLGSYYTYANSFTEKQLVDTKNAYYGSGGKRQHKEDGEGGYKNAVDDYKAAKGGGLNTSKEIAWRDRFIYGVKTGGNLEKYYGSNPSYEMTRNMVGGTSHSTVPSDQSMFLILLTIFDENGGRYYLNAPARGLAKYVGMFDSNRSDYYVVSMVGVPFFTIFGLISMPLLTMIVCITLFYAVLSVGIVDFNLRPLTAWAKGITLGDIEYAEAFSIYSIGIAGTILLFVIMPALIINVLNLFSNLVVKAIPTLAGFTATNPQASLAYNGVTLLVQGVFAIAFGVAYFKSPRFREIMGQLFTFVWAWASTAGARLEAQASRDGSMIAYKNRKLAGKGNKRIKQIDQFGQRMAAKALGKKFDPKKMPLGGKLPTVLRSSHDDDDMANNPDAAGAVPVAEKPKTAEDIKRDGQFERTSNSVANIQKDAKNLTPEARDATVKAMSNIDKFKQKPTQENYDAAKKQLKDLKAKLIADGAPQKDIDEADKALKNLDDLGKSYKLDTDKDLKDPKLDNKKAQTSKTIKKSENVEKRNNNDGKPNADKKPDNIKDQGKAKDNKSHESKPGLNASKSNVKQSQHGDSGMRSNKAVQKNKNVDTGDKQNLDTKPGNSQISSAQSTKPNTPKHEYSQTTHVQGSAHADNVQPVVKHHVEKTTTNAQRAGRNLKKVINVADKETTHNITSTNTNQPTIKHNTQAVRVVHDNQLKGVVSSLNVATENKNVRHALKQLRNSTNRSEVKRNIRTLQKSIKALDKKTKSQIDKKRLVNNLVDLQKNIKHK